MLATAPTTVVGRAAYYPDAEIFVAPADGRGQTEVTRSRGEDFGVQASPAGNTIAFVSARGGDGLRIYVSRLDGTAVRPLTPPMFDGDVALVGRGAGGEFRASRLAWSPDGRRLAFDATTTTAPPGCFRSCGNWRIYIINADGSALTRIADGNRMSWSPGGRRLAYRTRLAEDLAWGIATVDLTTGTHALRVARWPGTLTFETPSWSSDGSRIAFERWGTSRTREVDVLELRTGRVKKWTAGHDPIYAPQGAQLAFIRGTGIYMTSAPGRGTARCNVLRPLCFAPVVAGRNATCVDRRWRREHRSVEGWTYATDRDGCPRRTPVLDPRRFPRLLHQRGLQAARQVTLCHLARNAL
jgi:Tol biopolymer transport system component